MIVLIVLIFVVGVIVDYKYFVIGFVLMFMFNYRKVRILLKICVGVIGRRGELSLVLIKFVGRIRMDRNVWTIFSTQLGCIFSNHPIAQPSHSCNDPTQ